MAILILLFDHKTLQNEQSDEFSVFMIHNQV